MAGFDEEFDGAVKIGAGDSRVLKILTCL